MNENGAARDGPDQSAHFILRVQQLGKYCSSREARRATCSVMGACRRNNRTA